MRLTWKTLPYLLQRTLLAAIDDGCFWLAKGAAYSAILSFFPVLTSAAAILVMTRAEFVSSALEQFLAKIVPPGTESLVLAQFRAQGQKSITLLIVAALLSLWAAASVIKSLMQGFNAAYRVPRSRSFLHETGVAILLVFLAVIPLVGASALVLFGGQAEQAVLAALRVDPRLHPLAGAWRSFTAVARYLVSIGAGIALLVWMYLLAVIAILGCEFNAEYERLSSAEPTV